jgi:hypothetical protein
VQLLTMQGSFMRHIYNFPRPAKESITIWKHFGGRACHNLTAANHSERFQTVVLSLLLGDTFMPGGLKPQAARPAQTHQPLRLERAIGVLCLFLESRLDTRSSVAQVTEWSLDPSAHIRKGCSEHRIQGRPIFLFWSRSMMALESMQ